ncbi:MAG TPA: SDR family NAD(P)-dependent oxidoreductase [Leptospiraceae bacterium]|nr:SDR family NAD(P)-dependent oxidoreductase [Leptospiraceae bacterium]
MAEFKNKVVLITGGTDGMGFVTAKGFAMEGATLFITGRNKQKGRAAEAEIQSHGGIVEFIECDVSNSTQVKEMIDFIIQKSSSLDIAFNNAGITSKQHLPLADFETDEWNDIVNINLNGIFYCMKYELQAMAKQTNGGVIVNNSSVAGLVAMPMQAAYSASKAGVIALTKSAAIDYADKNIRINVTVPGPVMGGMNTKERLAANPERTAKKYSLTAMKRFAEPEEIAQTVLWLCSAKSSYITGATIPIDGGFSAGKW